MRSRRFLTRLLRSSAAVALLAVSASLITGCDNPACVFGGDCSGGGDDDPTAGAPAAVPSTGLFVDPAAPRIASVHPSGSGADPDTAVVVVFSESLPATAPSPVFGDDFVDPGNAFMLVADDPLVPPVFLGQSKLEGDGRVLILRPGVSLTNGVRYELRMRDDVRVLDYNGQSLLRPSNSVAGSFTIATTTPARPSVLMSYPAHNDMFQSETPNVVVVFTRRVSGVGSSSFQVNVGPPTPPRVLLVQEFLGDIPDSRVWLWQAVDAVGDPSSLGRDSAVEITLTTAIQDEGGGPTSDDNLLEVVIGFQTAPLGIFASTLLSLPQDAINVSNILEPPGMPSAPGMNGLDLQVVVDDVQATDRIEFLLVGIEPNPDPGSMAPPLLIALTREVAVGTTGASVSVSVGAAELDLVSNALPPFAGRFSDGVLAIAMRLRRGTDATPIVLFDADSMVDGDQLPVFDVTPPTVLEVGANTTDAIFSMDMVSDQPDIAIIGVASEPLRAAYVTTADFGDNGDPLDPPLVVGAQALGPDFRGLFVAAPVRLAATGGVLPPANQPQDFTLIAYDHALNPSFVPFMGTFHQVGATGAGSALGSTLTVEVYDAVDLTPIDGAVVLTHVDASGVVTLLDEDVTVGGVQTLDSTAGVGEEILLTVDSANHHLFTFHGVVSDRMSVLLERTSGVGGDTVGNVLTSFNYSGVVRNVSDSRLFSSDKLGAVQTCLFEPLTGGFDCEFGPLAVRAERVGMQTFLGTANPPAGATSFDPLTFLFGFQFLLPLAAVDAGATGTNALFVPPPINDTATNPVEEWPVDVPQRLLDSTSYPSPPDTPTITLEAISPGLSGAVVVGSGVAFPALPDTWDVRAAYPGAVEPTGGGGRLVAQGSIEPDLFLRAEVVDALGNRGVARPRLSAGGAVLLPPAPSTLITPMPGGNSLGLSYDITCSDVLDDLGGAPSGLYRVTLSDGVRNWDLWRPDPAGLGVTDVRVHVPTLGAMGIGLASGGVTASISAFAWPTLDLSAFTWAELGREPTAESHSMDFAFTQP